MTNPDSPPDASTYSPIDALIDAEFEEAPPPRPGSGRRSARAPARPLAWLPWAVLGAILLVALIATGPWALGWLDREDAANAAVEDPAPAGEAVDVVDVDAAAPPAPEPAAAEIAAGPAPAAAEAAELEALRAEVERLRREAAAAPAAPAPDQLALDQRVAALEQLAAGQLRVLDRLDQIENRLAELSDRIDQTPARAEFSALQARLAAAEQRSVRNPAESAYRFAALREAAARGAPFEAERSALARLRPDDADLAALQDSAVSGVPTFAELLRSYPAAQIRTALAQAPVQDTGRFAWLRRLFAGVATVRREGGAVDNTYAAVSSAEAALAAGDLAGAIRDTRALPDAAAQAASYWLGRAEARVRLDARIEAVQESLAREAAQ